MMCISAYCVVILFLFIRKLQTNFFACVKYQEKKDNFHISATTVILVSHI
jgi:hypothetical protein